LSPLAATVLAIFLWAISWMVAAVWTRRTQARPAAGSQVVYFVPLIIGGALLALGTRARIVGWYAIAGGGTLWWVPPALGWALFGLALLGLAFTWWARLTLGALWSSMVSRKQDHAIVERGPYRLVRHPIYTGLSLALGSFAVQVATAPALVGFACIVFGYWLKARLEERFLSAELGEAAYADYRRRTPMLAPFWPTRV
jgi:protein-S-isoprenylcysteine O-methyltransferase Ste14